MVRLEAGRILQDTLFVMIRFMSDEYDDTCSTIFPMLQMILASVGLFFTHHREPRI